MSKFEILFGGLCGFCFDDHGDNKGRLHALLVDSELAMNGGGMEEHSPLLVFPVNEVDLSASTAEFEVIRDPTGKALGVWNLVEKVVRLYSAGTEVRGTWEKTEGEVFPAELFRMAKADPDYDTLDGVCRLHNPKAKGKAVATRLELAGGKGGGAKLSTQKKIGAEWKFQGAGNPVKGDFAQLVQFEAEVPDAFVVRATGFRGGAWVLAFNGNGSVAVVNFPAMEEYHHFKAFYDLTSNPPGIEDRGFAAPEGRAEILGVRTGCIPNGFSG